MPSPSPAAPELVCPACSTQASGRFCANCGAALDGAVCQSCEASLTPGARFCHSCGHSVGSNSSAVRQPAQPGVASSLPWIVAAIALVMLLAFLGGSRFNSGRSSTLDAPLNALPQVGLDDRGPAQTGVGGQTPVRGPDISRLSPQERAERLFDRVMVLNAQGKNDSVQFFAPMAITAYQMLTPLSADHRYDMGRVAEVAGALPFAKSQADTILQQNPAHLLGLILGARIATLSNDANAKKLFETRLLAASTAESARRLPEYERHENDITSAVAAARRANPTSR